ncbi:MAG TPA: hypothetical protein VNE21_01230 [Mycobacteriales bacterium]|nr:hypothetical protein [Mycobacteriales bacterium]
MMRPLSRDRLQPRAAGGRAPGARIGVSPRGIASAWAGALILGAAAVGASGAASGAAPGATAAAPVTGLAPATLVSFLAREAGPHPHDLRIDGVYGSGHGGAWEFVAALSWRDASGHVSGGTTELPALAGQPALTGVLSAAQLAAAEPIGWTPGQLSRALSRLPGLDDTLALIDVEVTRPDSDLLACSGTVRSAHCVVVSRSGALLRSFVDRLTDAPSLRALAIQRVDAPVGAGGAGGQ